MWQLVAAWVLLWLPVDKHAQRDAMVVGADTITARQHWAFQPVRPTAPPNDPVDWSSNPIDRFVAARHRAAGLGPVGAADRHTLIRRVTFDLIGLPPTPDEVHAFVADSAPDAYTRLVERLLSSPHYGERWGRHWMDLVRYADTAGDNADYPVPEARLYRDYIIDSFNADKPYDEFLREQIAGDVLADAGPRERYAERVIATTFLGLSRRYLTAPYEQHHLTIEDTIDTVGRAFLGLTLRCARCHDHKFDPLTRQDYYALYGIFASTQYPYAGSEEFASMKSPRTHFVPLVPLTEAAPKLEARCRKVTELQAALAKADKEKTPQAAALRVEFESLRRTNLPPDLPGAYGVQEGKPADVPVQLRGEPDHPGTLAPRGVPRVLSDSQPFAIAPGSSGRLELARWLTNPRHPLTARVMVNRIWQHHFGRGLVATPSDFGIRGERPTDPELLDWLASEFVARDWSVKAMHRLILHSRTYQLASTEDPSNAARDPSNLYHWRADRRRLEAESIRDALLAVSGTLDLSRAGPHPFPPIEKWSWTQHKPFNEVYPTAHRSVYLMTQRFQRHPFLALFDGPDPNVSTDVRGTSTVPLQALFLRNNPFVHEQARGLSQRVLAFSLSTDSRITYLYELTFCRPPSDDEKRAASAYLRNCRTPLAQAGVAAAAQESEAWTSLARVLLASNEFVYVD